MFNAHLKEFIGFELKSTNSSAKKTVTAYQLVGADIAFPKDPVKRGALFLLFGEMHALLTDSKEFRGMTLEIFSARLDKASSTFADLASMLDLTRNIVRQTQRPDHHGLVHPQILWRFWLAVTLCRYPQVRFPLERVGGLDRHQYLSNVHIHECSCLQNVHT